jgi:motility quorum-sensing regulator / GCU-specific mRNA interferase toxin
MRCGPSGVGRPVETHRRWHHNGAGADAVEKRKPSFDLKAFKRVAGNPNTIDMTRSALLSADGLGFDIRAVTDLIKTMDRSMFYKSMTSYSDARKWQDVYHVPSRGRLTIYLKFTDDIIAKFTVLSFKER